MTTITIERELLEQALNALLLPCDRWNKQQFLIVKGAIESLNAALAAPATAPAQPERKPPQQDASLSATTKALTFARTALLVVNSGASQKAIALIDDALNQAPVQAQVLNPLTDGEKIYALWHSSDANDLDDFLDGWRHAEAFHGITGDKQ